MEGSQEISRFQEFFESQRYEELLENVRTGKKNIVVDFVELSKFDPDLAEALLETPEEIIKAAEISVERFDIEGDVQNFKVRFRNIPETQSVMIRDIRSKHIDKFIHIEGIIRQKSDVRPQVTTARFECPSCGNVINVVQVDSKFKEPSRCSCGRKGKFRLLSKELVDAQKIVLEEAPEDLDGGEQPKRLNIFLKSDLVSPMTEKRTNPGSRVLVNGILKEVPVLLSTGAKSTRYDLIMDANYVEPSQEDFMEISLDSESLKEIKELSKDPKVYDKLVESLAPSIYGHEKVKQALLLQMFGGVKKTRNKGGVTRGDIHILLIGDPGAGKSQLLKRIGGVAPKARYVTGASSTAAGLTASVVKDEFLRGYALEAGAMVLANKGIVCIDELDKMGQDDRAAMHEALEQQCFDYHTIIQLADGREGKIGAYVEKLLERHNDKVMQGKDCLVLEENIVEDEILSTDWNRIFPIKINRVSKHKAPEEMYRITYTNGRIITVTPEHPVFVLEKGKVMTRRADKIKGGECVPVPRTMPIPGKTQIFDTVPEEIYNPRAAQHITVPAHNDREIYRLVGYLLSEGSRELNRGKKIGLNFTNKNSDLLEDFACCMRAIFEVPCYPQIRADDHEPRLMLRYISTELAKFFEKELPEVLLKSHEKRIPDKLMQGKKEDLSDLLLSLFEGDGHVSVKKRTLRIGYGTNSRRLAEQIQDLLLRLGVHSSVTTHKKTYKVNITSYDNIRRFSERIGFLTKERREKVKTYLNSKSSGVRTYKDVLRACGEEIVYLLEKYSVKRVGSNNLPTMRHDYIRKGKGIARFQLKKLVETLRTRDIQEEDRELLRFLENMAFGEIGFERIKSVEKVQPRHPWTYDVTVEPHHTFISQGLVLHNTVTISKANIQATLRAETTLLAAANPKFGRFDPYELLAKQIDLPSTLINRFDLIFPIRDLPDAKKDEQLASFILEMHKKKEGFVETIPAETMRKYVAYAKQHIKPVLMESAVEEIKNYFVQMRHTATSEAEGIRSIPISARQLEALVRLAEASARTRLSDKVTSEDAKRAIDLVHYCLSQIGLDPETGKIDIDRFSGGVTASQRSHIAVVRDVITDLEKQMGKSIPYDEVLREAEIRGVSEKEVEEVLEKLKRSGDIFNPKPGTIQKI